MQRSTSITFDEADSFSSLSGSGADLSRYQEQLARERNSRTLSLRHINRISITGLQNANSQRESSQNNLVDPTNFPFLEPKKLIEIITSKNIVSLTDTVSKILIVSNESPRLLKIMLMGSPEVIDVLVNTLTDDISDQICLQLLKLTTAIFPHCNAQQETLIDGIVFSLQSFLESPNMELVFVTIKAVSIFSIYSAYARDSILSFEIHFRLIEIAAQNPNQELTLLCCQTLLDIFSNPTAISNQILIEAVDPLASLLKLNDKNAIAKIIDCFVEMSNKCNSLVFNLYDTGIYQLSVTLLKDEILIGPTLRLVGNLSVAQKGQVLTLLEAGLVPTLIPLLRTEYAPDAFWILSNLLENVTAEVLPYFDREFVQNVIDIANMSNFEIQKEASFFLSTMILFSPVQNLPLFMDQQIIDILVEMLGCGVNLVILRCMDTLYKFLKFIQLNLSSCGEFFTSLLDSDIKDRLQELEDQDSGLITERAIYVSQILSEIEAEFSNP